MTTFAVICSLALAQTSAVALADSTVTTPQARAIDVALDAQGHFHGQFVAQNGAPVAQSTVYLLRVDRGTVEHAVTATTDGQGRFVTGGMTGGQYVVKAGPKMTQLVRLWAPGTAPPAAGNSALIVQGQDVVRGQGFFGGTGLLIGLGVAGALIGTIGLINGNAS